MAIPGLLRGHSGSVLAGLSNRRQESRIRRDRKKRAVGVALSSIRVLCQSEHRLIFLYLNRVYYGSGAYGIEAASLVYFGKPTRSLSLHEAALLVQSLPSPSRWNVRANPVTAEKRAQALLEEMVKFRFIS